MNWYYWNEDTEVGPITERALRELEAAGIVLAETPIRPENSGEWTSLATLDAPAPPPSPALATYPQEHPKIGSTHRRTKTNKVLWIIAGASVVLIVIIVSLILAVKGAHDKTMVSELLKEADRIAFQTEGERDWDRAAILLKAAVEKGNHEAEYKLGTCYLFGRGVPQDKAEAARFFLRSSKGGYAEAQYNLALCYGKGDGVDRNEEEMLKWLKLAADQDFKQAQYFLGKLYLDGQAVPQNSERGIELLTAAAAQGLIEAQGDLSIYYDFGKVVPKNMVEAYKWMVIATRSGISGGDEELTRLRAQLGAAEISEGERLAEEWIDNELRK